LLCAGAKEHDEERDRGDLTFEITKSKIYNSKSQNLNLSFLFAAAIGDNDAIISLLYMGVDVNTRFEGGETALMASASRGHTKTARLLLDRGADINATDNNGLTALMYAEQNQCEDVVEILKEPDSLEMFMTSSYKELPQPALSTF
jgi:ankyrin repeat protein